MFIDDQIFKFKFVVWFLVENLILKVFRESKK